MNADRWAAAALLTLSAVVTLWLLAAWVHDLMERRLSRARLSPEVGDTPVSTVSYDHGSREVLIDRRGQTLALTLDEAWDVHDMLHREPLCRACEAPTEPGESSCRQHLPAGHIASSWGDD